LRGRVAVVISSGPQAVALIAAGLDNICSGSIDMAKMSTRTRNRSSNAEYVVSSMDENRDRVARGLLVHNAWLPEELRIDEATLRTTIEWMANVIRYKTSSMVASEGAYVDEQADDPPVRDARDTAVPAVSLCMSQTRNKVDAVLGEVALSTYALREPVPRQPAELAAYAGTSATLLRRYPRTAPDGTGGTLDTVTMATAIDEALKPLSDALSGLVIEQRQLQAAMTRRDTEVGEWNEVYINGTAAFAWLARMGRQPELAQRIRPTARRARGRDGSPANDVTPDLPGNDADDGAPADAPVVTPVAPEPIVIAPGK
jgi:hypothetical protein